MSRSDSSMEVCSIKDTNPRRIYLEGLNEDLVLISYDLYPIINSSGCEELFLCFLKGANEAEASDSD